MRRTKVTWTETDGTLIGDVRILPTNEFGLDQVYAYTFVDDLGYIYGGHDDFEYAQTIALTIKVCPFDIF